VLRAAGWSAAVHLMAVASLAWLATLDKARSLESALMAAALQHELDEGATTWIGAVPDDLLASEPLPPVPFGPVLPPTDQANYDLRPVALRPGLPGEQRAPAPDMGSETGRPLPAAWRRDSSTLRARLSDGSEQYQPDRQETSTRASTQQAIRQEPRVGIGDSARTTAPAPTQAAPPTDLPVTDDSPEVAPALASETRVPDTAGLQDTRGEGPLDTDPGKRSFDIPVAGPPRDDVASRSASNETQPGLVDYTAVAARATEDSLAGRGLGAQPGLSSHRTTGVAPSDDGWPRPRPAPIGEIGEGSSERAFSREYLEIRRRVARVLRFPKRLALLLEQGEAIVQFTVERDGRVWGDVKLLKSAGFEEFDREAQEVVRRAAPFPHLPERLLVRMRVPFENPIIR
jgi:TonB family protein